jgi:hypothetical protein
MSWYGRWRDDVLEDGRAVRKQRARKLADYCDRFRTERDVQPLLDEILRPLNQKRAKPESNLSIAEYVEDYYLEFVRDNCKPSTCSGYKTQWQMYLAPRLTKVALRDFRTCDAAKLFDDIFHAHKLSRSTLRHLKSFLSGMFTFAINQGVLDGINPIREARIPKKANAPAETHAASPDEVLAMLNALERAGNIKACAAVALMFFGGLRPGEARGVCWTADKSPCANPFGEPMRLSQKLPRVQNLCRLLSRYGQSFQSCVKWRAIHLKDPSCGDQRRNNR